MHDSDDILFLSLLLVPLTVLSVITSSLSLTFTSWRLHQKELNDLKELSTEEAEVCKIRSFMSFQGWFSTEILISVISTVALCMMTWIELFSGELLTEQVGLGVVKTNVHIIPLLILLISIPINAVLHSHYTAQRSPFSFAHGILSSVFPARYDKRLHSNKILENQKYILEETPISYSITNSIIFAGLSIFNIHRKQKCLY